MSPYGLETSENAKPVGREIRNSVELQIALARKGFSPGSIDASVGEQTRLALRAFQKSNNLPVSGQFDESTKAVLKIEEPTHAYLEISETALRAITDRPKSWRQRGEMPQLGYHSVLEMVAEKTCSHPDYIRRINPQTDWTAIRPGHRVLAPLVPPYRIVGKVGAIHIHLQSRQLQAYSASGDLVFHCPVSIARDMNKRPSGTLRVEVRVEDPNYTFNPAILSSAAAREGITRKFVIQPGPNNPVGTIWLGLDRPSYGIHGTPEPEKVGRTESSGCFRLANWNAETLLAAVEVGTVVIVSP